MATRLATAAVAALAVMVAAPAAPASASCVNVETRDGVELNTCVWWNKGDDPKPAIMDRSPYGHFALELLAVAFGLLEDHVGVEQDQRGTHASTGNFTIWHNSAPDNYDTMKWAANQSWSNGQIYTVGASADGLAEFMTLAEPSPHTAGQVIVFAGTKGYDILFPGHTFRQQLAEKWLEGTVPLQAPGLIDLVKSHETPDEWWNEIDVTHKYGNVKWPSVHWAGWYDIFVQANLYGFDGYRKNADPAWRDQARIVVDPLGHAQSAAKYFPEHLIKGRAILPILLAWDLFKNETSKAAENVKAVTYYVMGPYNETGSPGNYWTTLDDWPAPQETKFYLGAGGTLGTEAPQADGDASFVYDPANPVPTLGGNNLELPAGPSLQNSNEARDDVLTFTTAPLTAPVYVTGALWATLYVGSNATDTDFTVMITDVYPNGDSRQIQDGIARVQWRNCVSHCVPEPMEEGQVYELSVSMWNTSYAFAPGHSIRVDVSSSNYPRFAANPNVARALNATGPVEIAENKVVFSPQYPSYVTLPVVTPEQQPPAFVVYDENGVDTGKVRFSDVENYDEFERRAEFLERYVQLVTKW